MDPRTWPKVEELYHAALDKSAEQREAFLDEACGEDAELRREVQSLLAHEREAERLLEQPAASATTQKLAVARGTRLGPYEVVELIGVGGMGEVYRARDTRLGRDVAVKVLPEQVSHDAAALARFGREARAVASLSHPHISALFDIGETGGTHYLVMELLEGETLAARLRGGALPEKQRKPDAASEMTASTGLGEGVLAGTLPYMAPELLEGREADARADVWALGCVLFEMLAGRRAFEGDSQARLIAAIEKDDAPSLPPATASPAVERLVRQCLEKNPEERFQSTRDLAFALEALSGPSGREVAKPARPKRRRLMGAALFAAVSTGILVAVWLTHPSGSPPVGPFTPLTSDTAVKLDVAFSPDGKQLAFTRGGEDQPDLYVNPPDLYVKLIGGGEPIFIARHAWSPAWSPDGREIAFIRHLEKAGEGWNLAVFAVPALGGPERPLATLGQADLGLSYSPDGRLLAISKQETPDARPEIFLLSVETGKESRLTRRAGHLSGDYQPRFSPDGRTLAFVRVREGFDEDVYVVPVAGGEPRRVTRGCLVVRGFDWAPDGRSLVLIPANVLQVTTTTLFRVPSAGGELQPLGFGEDPTSLAVSRRGNRLAYARNRSDPGIWRLSRPAAGQKEEPPIRILASNFFDWNGQYSPDGRQITFTSSRSGYGEVWVSDGDGSNPRRLTFLDSTLAGTASWSPDGRELCFSSNKPGNADIYVVPAAGGIPRQLTTDPSNEGFCSWSRDGRWVYFDSSRSGRRELWRVSPRGGTATQVTRHGGVFGQEAPDGRSLYFTKANLFEPGPSGLWQMPVEGGEEKQVLPSVVSDGFSVVGRGVYHLNRNVAPGPAIEFYDFATGRASRIAVLTIDGELHSWGFAVSPDERSFLYTVWPKAKSDIVLVENFR